MFVSYVREDASRVDGLCHVLEAAQIPYWRDRTSLAPGDHWKAKIREAIRSNSLVFLACFSDQSRTRDRSHMNEELALAVEEFRKLAPGKTWLIPVRFDEGPLPEWDLGAGRMLSDLNYVDLFGDTHTAQVAALVATIGRLMGGEGPDATTVQAAVAQAADLDRPALVRRLSKEMLPDPARRIALDDLVREEVRRVLEALKDDSRFPVDKLPGSGEEQVAAVVRQATNVWHLVEPFVWSLEVAVRWAEPAQLSPWAHALRSYAAEASKARNGMTALLGLRYIPGTVSAMSAGLAAVSSGRWDNLKSLLVDQTASRWGRDHQDSLLDLFEPWAAFREGGNDWVAHTLARTVLENEDPETAVAAFTGNKVGRYHTPVAEWLHRALRNAFQDIYPDDESYDQDFDKAEVMLGLISQDLANQRDAAKPDRAWPARSRWFGRSTWRANKYHGDPIASVQAELAAQGSAWPPLRASLFGGEPDRAQQALDSYKEMFHQISSQQW